ncbi:hypothetical protein ACL02U_23605 [Streptomyces sp. MS06]|uniref:hypothetical protein n=1 Tax=Streptomyces sp. MS06 TaxID=3385974 RepID=UPI0039A2D206
MRLTADRARAALVTDGRIRQAECRADDDRALPRLLRDLARDTSPRSVTWDVSTQLDPARFGSPVATLRITPRPPVHTLGGRHPSPLLRSLVRRRALVTGGHDLFDVQFSPLDAEEVLRSAASAYEEGTSTFAVTATGAPGSPDHELAAAELIRSLHPQTEISLSHEVGGLGLVDRGAATVINAALLSTAERVVEHCAALTGRLGQDTSVWFMAGDGGRISGERLRTLPVLGLSATSAAALIGAAALAGYEDALVGLAGPDGLAVGHVRGGLPRVATDLPGPGGVRMAVPQTPLTPITGSPADSASVFALLTEHDQFPGVIAVASGASDGANPSGDDHDRHDRHKAALERARAAITRLPSTSVLVEPPAELAAVGAAFAEPSAWLDTVFYAETPEKIARKRKAAEQRALTLVARSGAILGSEHVVDAKILSLSFLPSGAYRLMVRASGQAEVDP